MSRSFFTAKLAAFLAVSFSVSSCTRQHPVQAKQERRSYRHKVAPVTSREVRRIVQSVGTLFPFDESVISAEIEGRVTEVNADLGDGSPKDRYWLGFRTKSSDISSLRRRRSCVWQWSA